MKIRYDGSGNINAACIDSQSLGGSTVVTIPDNAALLANPWKYTWDAGSSSLVLRKAIVLSTSTPSAPANGTTAIVVNLAAYGTNGAPDTTATYTVNLVDMNARGGSPIAPVTLVAGVGSASFTSSAPKKMSLSASSAGVLNGSLQIAFA